MAPSVNVLQHPTTKSALKLQMPLSCEGQACPGWWPSFHGDGYHRCHAHSIVVCFIICLVNHMPFCCLSGASSLGVRRLGGWGGGGGGCLTPDFGLLLLCITVAHQCVTSAGLCWCCKIAHAAVKMPYTLLSILHKGRADAVQKDTNCLKHDSIWPWAAAPPPRAPTLGVPPNAHLSAAPGRPEGCKLCQGRRETPPKRRGGNKGFDSRVPPNGKVRFEESRFLHAALSLETGRECLK